MTKQTTEQRKKNKKKGNDFEKKVRKDIEKRGFFVSKWANNVEFVPVSSSPIEVIGQIVPAKMKFNPFTKRLMMGKGGFPDFICFKYFKAFNSYEVYGVEARFDGYLSAQENKVCRFLLENNVFAYILIAKSVKEGRKSRIEYSLFKSDKKLQKNAEKPENFN